jgi:photosystem II S4 domain protein
MAETRTGLLPRQELLAGSRDPAALASVLDAAETALRTWQPCWTGFVDGAVAEEAEARLASFSELGLARAGGYPGAERCCLLVQRAEAALDPASLEAPLTGLEISGNFLFDPAEPDDVRAGLLAAGLAEAALGDIWMRGDRGAQAVLLQASAERCSGGEAHVRTVPVTLAVRPLADLQLPPARQPRPCHSVEASCRLDAVASAGFGVSRSRMAEWIRAGRVRVNWEPVCSPSRELAVGDRVRIGGRGELRINAITATKRERWRLEMTRL